MLRNHIPPETCPLSCLYSNAQHLPAAGTELVAGFWFLRSVPELFLDHGVAVWKAIVQPFISFLYSLFNPLCQPLLPGFPWGLWSFEFSLQLEPDMPEDHERSGSRELSFAASLLVSSDEYANFLVFFGPQLNFSGVHPSPAHSKNSVKPIGGLVPMLTSSHLPDTDGTGDRTVTHVSCLSAYIKALRQDGEGHNDELYGPCSHCMGSQTALANLPKS